MILLGTRGIHLTTCWFNLLSSYAANSLSFEQLPLLHINLCPHDLHIHCATKCQELKVSEDTR